MKCPNCDGRGAVQIAPNVKGLKRCPVCGGSGKITEYDGLRKFWCDYKCDVCNGKGVVEPITEQEYLQTCTTEQLARIIYELMWHKEKYPELCVYPVVDSVVEWLKQPHKESEK